MTVEGPDFSKGLVPAVAQDAQSGEILIDCDRDTVVLKVLQHGGAACHLGYRSCFFRRRDGDSWATEGEPVFDPSTVYRKPHP